MHNCAGPLLLEKDVAKFVDRYNLHPEFAQAAAEMYQELLRKFESLMEEQGKKIAQEKDQERTGRSRAESAERLAEAAQHLKREARKFLEIAKQ